MERRSAELTMVARKRGEARSEPERLKKLRRTKWKWSKTSLMS